MKKLFAFKFALTGLFDGINAVFTVDTLWRPATAGTAAADSARTAVNSLLFTSGHSITWYTLVQPSSKKHLLL